MKRIRAIAGICLGLLLVASFVVGFMRPSPIEVAKAKCVQEGWLDHDLDLMKHKGSEGWFANQIVVEFQARQVGGPRNAIRVELRQPVYFLAWEIVEYREEFQGAE